MAGTVVKSNNAEIGLANGATVNSANSGGGTGNDAWNSVNPGTGNTFVVTNSSPIDGTFSYLITPGGTTNQEIYWVMPSLAADWSFQYKFIHQNPTAAMPLLRVFSSLTIGSGIAWSLYQKINSGKYYIFDHVASAQTADSAGTATNGTPYVLNVNCASGLVQVNIAPKGTSAPTITLSQTQTAISVGHCRFGTPALSTSPLKFDTVKMGTGGFLARDDVSAAAPTASVGGPLYLVAGATANLTGTDSDTDGTVTSRQWTWSTADTSGPLSTTRKWLAGPTISGATTQNATAVMATPGAYRAQYVVTDDTGTDSAPVYQNVFVAAASGVSVAVRNELRGAGWSAVGGGGLTDGSDTTGSRSIDDPIGAVDTLLMNPHGPGTSANAITVALRGNSTGGALNRTVKWYGATGTLLDTQTSGVNSASLPATLPGTPTTAAPTTIGWKTYVMSSGVVAALSNADRAELVVTIGSSV